MKSIQDIRQPDKYDKPLTKFTKPPTQHILQTIWITGRPSFDDYEQVKLIVSYNRYFPHTFILDDSVGLSQTVFNAARGCHANVIIFGKGKRPRNNAPMRYYYRIDTDNQCEIDNCLFLFSSVVFKIGEWSSPVPESTVLKSGKPMLEVTKGTVARKHNLAIVKV